MSDEYLEGRWAFFQGYGEDENPYDDADMYYGTERARQRDDWQSGWYAAESGQ